MTHFCQSFSGAQFNHQDDVLNCWIKLYPNRRCYPSLNHHPKHILAAQELANWIKSKTSIFGTVEVFSNVTSADFTNKKGIVFIKNGWGSTDHIDVWDGIDMKGGSPQYFALGEEVWFWPLS